MVVFKGLIRSPQILYNERVLCGLGRSLRTKGLMDEEAVEWAISTLKRFAFLCEDMAVDEIEVIATAAVREAKNGPDFITRVSEECGFKIQIILGDEEANLSAMGVISAFENVTGIVGDLGGGSLELALINKDEIIEEISLPLGPLRILDGKSQLSEEDKSYIQQEINSIPWLNQCVDAPFYMVGGSWRVLSKLHLHKYNWPVHVLHGYKMSTKEAIKFSKNISKKAPMDLVVEFSKNYKRTPILPAASFILNTLLKVIEPKNVYCSSQGIREGIHYKKLSPDIQRKDPFIEACKDIAVRTTRFPEHAQKLFNWMKPLLENETSGKQRLCFACCLLSDISWRGHPDFRAEMAFDNTLFGHFIGVSHKGRTIVSLALYLSYGGSLDGERAKNAFRVLSDKNIDFSQTIGAALRLGQRLTGGSSKPLEYTNLLLGKETVTLNIPNDHKDLVGSSVKTRLKNLGKVLERKWVVTIC
jgi:exopolyphosphatase/guanosine-5'-triphosphate,3'-diphosphate pyrophosphatase